MSTATPAQLLAATHVGESILVSAAAGSGKTSTIASRVAHLVCQQEVPLDQILVVTFTDNAATEMRSRIEKRLREEAGKCGSPHTRRQLLLASRAQVSTIHAFCNRLIRQHFPRLGIDPRFDLLTGETQSLLQREALRQTLDEAHLNPDDAPFKDLLHWYANSDDVQLGNLLLKISNLLTSIVDIEAWRRRGLALLEDSARNPEASALGKAFASAAHELAARLQEQCQAFLSRWETSFPEYARHVRAHMLPAVENWAATSPWSRTEAPTLPRAPTIKNPGPDKELAKAQLDELKAAYDDAALPGALPGDATFWKQSTDSTLPHLRELLRLSAAFEANYRRAKDAKRALDFADLERFALHLLSDGSHPSDIARELHQKFRHVLVDECQDVNAVQDRLITLVSTECLSGGSGGAVPGNLFSVGDVKQSIYRFRLAEPELFQQRQKTYAAGSGKVILLDQNFRSRKPLLDALNVLFSHLMVGDKTIRYREGHELRAGLAFEDATFPGAPLELHLLEPPPKAGETSDEEDDYNAIEREAAVIAVRLKELIGQAEIIGRDGKKRRVRPGDCAILLRAATIKANQVAAMLRSHGLSVQADTRGGLLEAQEITDILALLQLLDNPHQDLPMVAYLRSPLSGVSSPDAALARARVFARDLPLHRAVHEYATSTVEESASYLREALDRLRYWRELAQRRPIAEVLDDVLRRTAYATYVAGLPDGAQRSVNLAELLMQAREFSRQPGRDLSVFLKFLEDITNTGAGFAEADAAVGAEDAVRVMTIHKSKGLEFPIVVLPDLAKRFNEQDLNTNVLVGRDIPLALKAVDASKDALYPSPAWVLARAAQRDALVAEELRTLYVGLTRAREHVILVATAVRPDSADALPLREADILGVHSPVQWLLPLAALQPNLFDVREIPASAISEKLDRAAAGQTAIDPRIPELKPIGPVVSTPAMAQAVIDAVGYQYPHADAAERSAAVSVTALTHSHYSPVPVPALSDGQPDALAHDGPPPVERTASADAKEFPLPRLLSAQTAELAATDKGTATHVTLEHFDFRQPADAGAVEQFLGSLVTRGVLSAREASAVDLGAFAFLAASELAPFLRGDEGPLYRELPIYLPNPNDTAAEGLDRQMVRGRIDLLVDTPAGPVIIDYKTDSVSGPRLQERIALYAGQVNLYKHAAQAITGRPCAGVYLAFVSPMARTIVKL